MIIGQPMSMLIGRGGEAVFDLNCPVGPEDLRENYGFSRREMKQVRRVVKDNLDELCRAWEQIHGIA